MANLAQLVNVLPLIMTDDSRAYPTALYGPFWMYQHMQPYALRVETDVATFDSDGLGNIAAQQKVSYLDVGATSSQDGKRLALGIVNRHLRRPIQASFMLDGFEHLRGKSAWLQSASHPSAANSVEAPNVVRVREIDPAEAKAGRVDLKIPACAVMVQVFESTA
jgi:alpha-L-arabinofuranosidase